MPTLTLTLNPNFGESGFGETGFGELGRHRNIEVSWSHRLEFFQNNFTVMAIRNLQTPTSQIYSKGNTPKILAVAIIVVGYGKMTFGRQKL